MSHVSRCEMRMRSRAKKCLTDSVSLCLHPCTLADIQKLFHDQQDASCERGERKKFNQEKYFESKMKLVECRDGYFLFEVQMGGRERGVKKSF